MTPVSPSHTPGVDRGLVNRMTSRKHPRHNATSLERTKKKPLSLPPPSRLLREPLFPLRRRLEELDAVSRQADVAAVRSQNIQTDKQVDLAVLDHREGALKIVRVADPA